VQSGRIAGVFARDASGALRAFPARATVLACGGIGALYALTTNPPQANGAALAFAARAGARIADAEFVQFHPTAIDIGRDPAPLATEALRGEGAVLVNRDRRRFMAALHRDAELAPRDVVARGVFDEVAAGRGAFLDAASAIGAEFAEKFPNVAATCRAAGIDPSRDPIPVAPAEHYHMGGIWTDARGRSSLAGLWVAGETASTGLHGANRLASNSLLEAVVFADRAARDIAAVLSGMPAPQPVVVRDRPRRFDESAAAELRQIMSRHVGVLRDAAGLAEALRCLYALRETAIGEASADLRNRAEAALLIAAAAFLRRESRGGHFRTDYPQTDLAQARRSFMTLDGALSLARGVAASEAA
jgi:L-aspartate oxidase